MQPQHAIKPLMIAVGFAIGIAVCAPPALAVDNFWAPASSGNWSLGSNWSLGHAPTPTEVARITREGNYSVTLDVNTAIAGLEVGGLLRLYTQSLVMNQGHALTLIGPGSITRQGSLILGSGTLNGSGVLTVYSSMLWTGGGMSGSGSTVINSIGQLTIAGSALKSLARPLIINGDATWTLGPFVATVAAPITVAGNFIVQSNADLVTSSTISGLGNVTFLSGTSNISGLYSVTSTTISGGTALFPVAMSTSSLTVSNGTINLGASSTIGAMSLTGGTLTGNGPVTLGATSTWSGGALSGPGTLTIGASIQLNINGTATKTLLKPVVNSGTIVWSGTGAISSGLGTTLTNQPTGTINLQSDAPFLFGEGGSPPSITNSALSPNFGQFRKSIASGSSTIAAIFTNSGGTVTAVAGTMAFNGGFTQSSGRTVLQSGTIGSTTPLAFNGGTLEGTGTVAGDVTVGDVTNAAVQPNGTITVNGNYTQRPTGTLRLDLQSLTTFDKVFVSGTASLSGTLQLSWSYTASDGDTFQVMTYGARSGTFDPAKLLVGDKATGMYFFPTYNAQNVTLTGHFYHSLHVQKRASASTVTTGTNVTYTIDVSNAAFSDANNVSISDPLPSNVTFVSATTTKGSCSGTTTVVCTIPKLLGYLSGPPFVPGETATITIIVRANAPGTATNTATGTATGTDFNPGDNSSTTGTAIQSRADLVLQKIDSRAPGQPSIPAGSNFGYLITVQNIGPETATSLVVTDPLPSGTTFLSASGSGWSCSFSAGVVTCSQPSLAASLTSNFQIQLRAPAEGATITNTASVAAAIADPNPANNAAPATTIILPIATLSATKTGSPNPVPAGGTLTYAIVVSNAGPSTAVSISVSDPIPPGTTLVSATGSGWSCNFASGTVTCTMPSLAVGAAPAISISVTTPSSSPTATTLANTATVSSAISTLVSASTTTTVNPQADVAITKSAPSSTIAGQTLAYTITVRNNGPSPATGVTVSDPTPPSLTFVSNQGACTTPFPCSLGTLAPAESRTITSTFSVPSGYTSPNPIVNTATVTSSNADPDSTNNGATASTGVGSQSGVTITKSASPNPVDAGAALTYTINVTNLGPSVATSVTVSDLLPTGTTFRSVSGNGWSCAQASGTVTCTMASLAVAAAPTISIDVTAPATGGSITNSATVTAAGSNPSTASTTTAVTPRPGLSIAKSASPNPVDTGAMLTYTINVTNLGPGTATSLTVSDPLPPGTTFRSVTGNGWSCAQASGAVSCTLASLAVGAAPPISIQVTAPGSAGSIINTAIVSAAGSAATSASTTTQVATPCANSASAVSPPNGTTNASADGLLTWQGSADSYKVYLGTSPGGCQTLFGTTPAGSLRYSGLSPNRQYEWRVEALRTGCPTVSSSCNTFRTAANLPTARISAAPTTAKRGTPVVVLWTTQNAESVTLEPGLGRQNPSGVLVDRPFASKTYTLNATNQSGTTSASVQVIVVGGPLVTALVSRPIALAQSPGVGGATAAYALRNDGDTPATVSVSREGSFFTQSPSSLTIAPGSTEIITITGLPNPSGIYQGKSILGGAGVAPGTGVSVSLLVAPTSGGGGGSAAAAPEKDPIELTAESVISPSGAASFRNWGTVALTATASSGDRWLLPQTGSMGIPVGGSKAVSFSTNRLARPDGDRPLGTVAGTLWLDFIGTANQHGSTHVTVLDTAVAATTPAQPPPIGSSERVYFLPGISNEPTAAGTLSTDVVMAYPFGARDLSVTRLYFTANGVSTVATIDSLAPSRSFTLANIVTSVYRSDAGTGTLQVRTADADAIYVSAQRMTVRPHGVVGGAQPVFRSDRAAAAGEDTILTGIASGNRLHTDLYVQETSGNAARVRMDFLDAAGRTVGGSIERDLAPFGLLEMRNAAPGASTTAIVTNLAGSTGRIVAHALLVDELTGDQSAIVDGTRYFGYSRKESVVIPTGLGASYARRRAVSLGPPAPTGIDLAIFNADPADGQATLRMFGTDGQVALERIITVRSRETLAIRSLQAYFNLATMIGSIELIPSHGSFVVSPRLTRQDASGGTTGASLAAFEDQSGLSLGQSTVFAGLADSRSDSANRTESGLLLLETSGRPAKVLVTLNLDGGRSPLQFSREVTLQPRNAVLIDRVVRELIGPSRERDYPDLFDVNLHVDIVEGGGTVIPTVVTTDIESGDCTIRFTPGF